MARSTYVYTVEFSGDAILAFTVKHELVTYLRRVIDPDEINDHIAVWRLRDGWHRNVAPTQLDLNDLIKEG